MQLAGEKCNGSLIEHKCMLIVKRYFETLSEYLFTGSSNVLANPKSPILRLSLVSINRFLLQLLDKRFKILSE